VPEVVVERVIAAPREQVYQLAKNMEAFAEYLPNAKEIRTLERLADSQLTEWVTQLKGMTFRWVERESFDDENLKIYYEQTEGDLAVMKGEWSFEEHPEGTHVTLTCTFEFGMPALAAVLNPIGAIAVRENISKLLEALDRMAQAARE